MVECSTSWECEQVECRFLSYFAVFYSLKYELKPPRSFPLQEYMEVFWAFYIFLKSETPLSLVLGGIQTHNLLYEMVVEKLFCKTAEFSYYDSVF